ncbi:MAG: thioredoxin family protein [Gammaproteobacteria bacterium]|nr:thioredoxin family protein [Gammaproteobacteria bacterium]
MHSINQTIRFALAAVVLSAAGTAQAAADVGAAAPDFSLPDSNGETRSLSDFGGQYVVLEWTNDGCPFVRKHYGSGNMQSLQKEYTAKDVAWLSIISSAPGEQGHVSGAEANALTAERDAAPTAVLLDPSGDVGREYGAKTTPHMYIIDPKGTLIYAGGIDSIPSANPQDIEKATPYVKLALDEAMAGKPVSQAQTRPYGCSVKY